MARSVSNMSASELFRRASSGDESAFAQLLQYHRPTLRRMISLRLDRRIRGRLDPSDVIQEAFITAARRFSEYVDNPSLPFYLWLRTFAVQTLINHYRRHLGAQSRDVAREFTLDGGKMPEASSAELAGRFLAKGTTPCTAAMREEQRVRLQEALNQMDPIDREILALRHFEQLSNSDAATVLGLDKSAASKRYARALVRLKTILRN